MRPIIAKALTGVSAAVIAVAMLAYIALVLILPFWLGAWIVDALPWPGAR